MRRLLHAACGFACAAAAAACSVQPSCTQCGGRFDPVHCKCTCPLSKVESLMVGYVGCVAVVLFLLA
jgi:hypothetical protein